MSKINDIPTVNSPGAGSNKFKTETLLYMRRVERHATKGSPVRRVLILTRQSIFLCTEQGEVKRMIPVTAVTEIRRGITYNMPQLLLVIPHDHDFLVTFYNDNSPATAQSHNLLITYIQLIHKAWTSRTIPLRPDSVPGRPLEPHTCNLKKPDFYANPRTRHAHLEKLCLDHTPPIMIAPPPTFAEIIPAIAHLTPPAVLRVVQPPSDPGMTMGDVPVYDNTAPPKSQDVVNFLAPVMRTCSLFEKWTGVELCYAMDAMTEVSYARGDIIMNERSHDSISFNIIVSGHVSVLVNGRLVNVLKPGSFFGERNVMFARSSTDATLRVDDASGCTCYSLSSRMFRRITVWELAYSKRNWAPTNFLDGFAWVANLDTKERLGFFEAIQPMPYIAGEKLSEYGSRQDWIFFILSGLVDIVGRDETGVESVHVCTLSNGDTIGDFEFLNNRMTAADAVARGQVTAARLSREHFDVILGRVLTLMRRGDVARPPHVPLLKDYYDSIILGTILGTM